MADTIEDLRATLDDFRLRRGWSFEQLAFDMAKAHPDRAKFLSSNALRRFLRGETTPHDTTRYAIAVYVEGIALPALAGDVDKALEAK